MTAQPLTQPAVHGVLDLRLHRPAAAAHTVLIVRDQRQPLQVVRAFRGADGAALVHLHNVSGGIVDGDTLETTVEVEPGAAAQLTTTGATRVYRRRSAATPGVSRMSATVGAGALLEYLPDQLIPYAGAAYCQRTRVELAPDAGLFWWEIVAPGRVARGELFAYERLDLRFELVADGQLVALEHTLLEPGRRPVWSPLVLGGFRYLASFWVCRAGLPQARWLVLEAELAALAQARSVAGVTEWGVSALPAAGLLVRALSTGGRPLLPGLTEFWTAAKRALYDSPAVPPRKVP